MSDEFATVAPPIGESAGVAPQGQGGALDGTSGGLGVPAPQIAEPQGEHGQPPTPTVDWTQDPKFRDFQSRLDKAEALNAKLQREMEERERREAIEREQRETSSLETQYQQEYVQAATPEAKAQVYAKYQQLATQRLFYRRDQQVVGLTQRGLPIEVAHNAILTAGNDPQRQMYAIDQAAIGWFAQRAAQPAPAPVAASPSPQPVYQPVPVSPATSPVAPAMPQPATRTATPVARPGGVTPAAPSYTQLYREAMASQTQEAWARVKAARQTMERTSRN